ncbi:MULTISPECIES: MFS transporter [unclassified Streptomyces]|uniref:MDR family MFS transporter n=1 Tax=unclassified Streptomyces TaxID=2593676 RepID=UPI00278C20E5|nr:MULTISPECIES: MFS transporter [unclassified Streptomyces]
MSIRSQARKTLRDGVSGLPAQFWWLWTSTLINRLGSFVTTFLTLYLTAERGYSVSYAGLVTALYGLGGSAAAVVGGVLVDRVGRRPTLLLSQVATALSTAVLGFVQDPVLLAVVACLVGISSNAQRPAVQAMMADIVPAADRVRAFSLNYWAVNIGFAAGSSAAGMIAGHGYQLLFLVGSCATLVCGLVVFFKLPESRPANTEAPAGKEKSGLLTVTRDGRFMKLVFLTFLVALLLQQGPTALPVSMNSAGFSAGDYGLVISVNGILIVLLQIPLTRFIDNRDVRGVLFTACLLCAAGWGLTSVAGSVGFYAFTVALWTLAEIIHAPTSMSLVAAMSPTHARGRYQGMYALAWQSAAFVGPLLAGFVMDGFGDTFWWITCAAIGTVAALGYWRFASPRAADGGGHPAVDEAGVTSSSRCSTVSEPPAPSDAVRVSRTRTSRSRSAASFRSRSRSPRLLK